MTTRAQGKVVSSSRPWTESQKVASTWTGPFRWEAGTVQLSLGNGLLLIRPGGSLASIMCSRECGIRRGVWLGLMPGRGHVQLCSWKPIGKRATLDDIIDNEKATSRPGELFRLISKAGSLRIWNQLGWPRSSAWGGRGGNKGGKTRFMQTA